jgi:predicted porin
MNVPTKTQLAVIAAGLAGLPIFEACAQSLDIYGVIGAYVGSVKRSGESTGVPSVNGGGLNTSYIGFRGREDLGSDWKAIFTLESFFRPDTGEQGRNSTDPLFSRNAWIGLENRSFGRLSFGRHTNPTYAVMNELSPFGTSVVFSPLALQSFVTAYGSNIIGDSVWNNVIQYASPDLYGFRGSILYGLGEVPDKTGIANLGLHINYKGGKLFAALSAQRVRVNVLTPFPQGQYAYLAGAAYDFGMVKLYGNAEYTSINDGNRTRMLDVGFSIPVSATGSILAEAAQTRLDATNAADTHRTTASLGYDYRLSKRTDVYAIYTYDKRSNAGTAGTSAIAIRHLF